MAPPLVKDVAKILKENGFNTEFRMYYQYIIAITKKDRTFNDMYSIFFVRINSEYKITYESHQMSFGKLTDAIMVMNYLADETQPTK